MIKIPRLREFAYARRGAVAFELKDYQQAVADATMCIHSNPSDWHHWVDRGFFYHALGKQKEAEEDFNEAIKREPTQDPYCARARYFELTRQYEKAHEDMAHAIALAPEDARPYLERAVMEIQHMRKEKLSAAEATKMKRMIEADLAFNNRFSPRGPNYRVLADFYMYCDKDYKSALSSIDRALAKEPNNVEFLRTRAIVLRKLGRTDQALNDLARAQRLEPKSCYVYTEQADCYRQSNEPTKAVAAYTKALSLTVDPFGILCQRAFLYNELGQPKKAIADLHSAMKVKPGHVHLYTCSADIAHSSGDVDGAIKDLELGLKNCHSVADGAILRLALADLLNSNGEEEKALDVLDEFVNRTDEKDKQFAQSHRCKFLVGAATKLVRRKSQKAAIAALLTLKNRTGAQTILLANMYRKIGQPRQAVALLDDLIVHNKFNPEAIAVRASINFGDLGECEKAEMDYTTLIPVYWQELSNRAQVRVVLGKTDEAIADLTDLFRMKKNLEPKELSFRGMLLMQQGRTAEAMADFNRSLRIEETSFARGRRGQLNFLAGDYKQAISDLSAAIKVNPMPSVYFKMRAVAFNKLGDYRSSLSDLQVLKSRKIRDPQIVELFEQVKSKVQSDQHG